MTFERSQQLQLDLIALRAQEDRLVTESVLRRDWDDAATHAARAQRVTLAIERMLTTGRAHPADVGGSQLDSPVGGP